MPRLEGPGFYDMSLYDDVRYCSTKVQRTVLQAAQNYMSSDRNEYLPGCSRFPDRTDSGGSAYRTPAEPPAIES